MSAPFDTAAAIAQANKWTEAGEHLVPILLKLKRMASVLNGVRDATMRAYPRKSPHLEIMEETNDAAETLDEAFGEIRNNLENLRETMTDDALPADPESDDEAEWTEHARICDEIEAGVISVSAFIKKMEMEA